MATKLVETDLFRSSTLYVDDSWIDNNEHVNVAYYVVLFDRCVDEAFAAMGVGEEYVRNSSCSLFASQMHVNYLAELARGAAVWSTVRLLEVDHKRLRIYLELFHAQEGFLSATSEQLYLHIDMRTRRVTQFEQGLQTRLKSLQAKHGALPPPPWVGRGISMSRVVAREMP